MVYTKGTEMFLTDILSRAYLIGNPDDFVHSLEAIDAILGLPVRSNRLQQIQHATAEDPDLFLLSDIIKAGWPEEKRSVQPAVWVSEPPRLLPVTLPVTRQGTSKGHQKVNNKKENKEMNKKDDNNQVN